MLAVRTIQTRGTILVKATMTALAVAATMFANSPWAADPDDLQELVDNGYFVKCDLTGANLKGANLWAAQRATDASLAGRLFPSYCDGETTKANSASAVLNKWLKVHTSQDVVVHSIRHAMRDRLLAVLCPADIIDQMGGWSRKGVGESYGRVYQVGQLQCWVAMAVG
tara:strand:- start:239 stop:742 length:504 start_codon:yes stop_codon:yes gene_type:complete